MWSARIAMSATLDEGVLKVNGKPFFPLGGWDEQRRRHTTSHD
jgi:hypothetical protein